MAESESRPRSATSEKPDSYEAAVERLEQIIDRLDSGQAGLRETLDLCREGRELVTYCAAELDAVGEGLKELKLDELAGEARRLSRAAERSEHSAAAPGSRGRGPSRASRAATGNSPRPIGRSSSSARGRRHRRGRA